MWSEYSLLCDEDFVVVNVLEFVILMVELFEVEKFKVVEMFYYGCGVRIEGRKCCCVDFYVKF